MKKLTSFAIAITFAVFASAQSAEAPAPKEPEMKPIAELLGWIAGDWEGQGVLGGETQFIAKMVAAVELDDQALLIKRESANKQGGPSGGKKEIMVIGLDGTTKKVVLLLNTSSNFIGIYTGEIKDHEVVFTLVTSQAGYVNRRIFKSTSEGVLSFVIEGSTPGKEVAKLVEINFKKKS